jgi:Flp pilus assembly pilin Flp
MRSENILIFARKLQRNTQGQDLVEYALMAAFVAVAAGAIFPTTIVPGVSTIFSKIVSGLSWSPS